MPTWKKWTKYKLAEEYEVIIVTTQSKNIFCKAERYPKMLDEVNYIFIHAWVEQNTFTYKTLTLADGLPMN